jgi:hypothetical protein
MLGELCGNRVAASAAEGWKKAGGGIGANQFVLGHVSV